MSEMHGLYTLYTTAKRALSFQQKRAQEIVFLFFRWGTFAQKKGHFFHLLPLPPPVLRPLVLILNTFITHNYSFFKHWVDRN
jgi:hypothetical protein